MRSDLDQARDTIRAEAYALGLLAEALDERFLAAVEIIRRAGGKVIATGMGKAGNVAAKIAATLRSTGSPAAFLNPAEAAHGDMGMIGEHDILLALSNSGETDEVLKVVDYCGRWGVPIIAITSRQDSPLARQADALIVLPRAREGCPLGRAPMASAAMMMAVGDALAAQLMVLAGFTEADFLELHHGGYLGRAMARGDLRAV